MEASVKGFPSLLYILNLNNKKSQIQLEHSFLLSIFFLFYTYSSRYLEPKDPPCSFVVVPPRTLSPGSLLTALDWSGSSSLMVAFGPATHDEPETDEEEMPFVGAVEEPARSVPTSKTDLDCLQTPHMNFLLHMGGWLRGEVDPPDLKCGECDLSGTVLGHGRILAPSLVAAAGSKHNFIDCHEEEKPSLRCWMLQSMLDLAYPI